MDIKKYLYFYILKCRETLLRLGRNPVSVVRYKRRHLLRVSGCRSNGATDIQDQTAWAGGSCIARSSTRHVATPHVLPLLGTEALDHSLLTSLVHDHDGATLRILLQQNAIMQGVGWFRTDDAGPRSAPPPCGVGVGPSHGLLLLLPSAVGSRYRRGRRTEVPAE
jgi:hypothetical protein